MSSRLSRQTIKKIKGNPALVARLVEVSDTSYPTVRRWIAKNSKFLTMIDCLNVICQQLKITQAEALEPVKKRALVEDDLN